MIAALWYRLRRWLAHRICPECVFNADMSHEIDYLTVEVERLRELVRSAGGVP